MDRFAMSGRGHRLRCRFGGTLFYGRGYSRFRGFPRRRFARWRRLRGCFCATGALDGGRRFGDRLRRSRRSGACFGLAGFRRGRSLVLYLGSGRTTRRIRHIPSPFLAVAAGSYSPCARHQQARFWNTCNTRRPSSRQLRECLDPIDTVVASFLQALAQSVVGAALPLPSQLLRLCTDRRYALRPMARELVDRLAVAALPAPVHRRRGSGTRAFPFSPLPLPRRHPPYPLTGRRTKAECRSSPHVHVKNSTGNRAPLEWDTAVESASLTRHRKRHDAARLSARGAARTMAQRKCLPPWRYAAECRTTTASVRGRNTRCRGRDHLASITHAPARLPRPPPRRDPTLAA